MSPITSFLKIWAICQKIAPIFFTSQIRRWSNGPVRTLCSNFANQSCHLTPFLVSLCQFFVNFGLVLQIFWRILSRKIISAVSGHTVASVHLSTSQRLTIVNISTCQTVASVHLSTYKAVVSIQPTTSQTLVRDHLSISQTVVSAHLSTFENVAIVNLLDCSECPPVHLWDCSNCQPVRL